MCKDSTNQNLHDYKYYWNNNPKTKSNNCIKLNGWLFIKLLLIILFLNPPKMLFSTISIVENNGEKKSNTGAKDTIE